ncbi:hypothetical protein HDE_06737 [Halotydeus destructor]|nr:hypothetical protein HDE_06737 [Halotydeus destructor]
MSDSSMAVSGQRLLVLLVVTCAISQSASGKLFMDWDCETNSCGNRCDFACGHQVGYKACCYAHNKRSGGPAMAYPLPRGGKGQPVAAMLDVMDFCRTLVAWTNASDYGPKGRHLATVD